MKKRGVEILQHGTPAGQTTRPVIRNFMDEPIIHGHKFDPTYGGIRPFSFNENFDKLLRFVNTGRPN